MLGGYRSGKCFRIEIDVLDLFISSKISATVLEKFSHHIVERFKLELKNERYWIHPFFTSNIFPSSSTHVCILVSVNCAAKFGI